MAARGRTGDYGLLAALAFAAFMTCLDNTVVNVALPLVQQDLGLHLADLEWVAAAYPLTFAALLTGGRSADVWGGRRPTLLTGLGPFTTVSLLCGLCGPAAGSSPAAAFRAPGAALVIPASLAVLTRDLGTRARTAGVATWMAALAAAAAFPEGYEAGLMVAAALVAVGALWPGWHCAPRIPVDVSRGGRIANRFRGFGLSPPTGVRASAVTRKRTTEFATIAFRAAELRTASRRPSYDTPVQGRRPVRDSWGARALRERPGPVVPWHRVLLGRPGRTPGSRGWYGPVVLPAALHHAHRALWYD
ncbi:MFS transporter [Streptomyces sp. NPDC051776]|uniref:MFS transporter n=1 Tax=Streptomyces sp. NPDC051776 TaxID=3155414 RepID=UPI003447508A